MYVAVPGRNRTLFCCLFRLCCRLKPALFPSLLQLQFLITCSIQKWKEKANLTMCVTRWVVCILVSNISALCRWRKPSLTMLAAYPLIIFLPAWMAVLPASSAEVKQVFSAVKCIKTPMRNWLCTRILDSFVRVTMDGPNTPLWNPLPAALKWESCNWKRRLKLVQTSSTSTSNTSSDWVLSSLVSWIVIFYIYISGVSRFVDSSML